MQYNKNKEEILLAMMPYWSPLIPPMGISCLKSFLEPHGYRVTTTDVNTEKEVEKIYNNYFDTLKSYIPPEKQGNFYNLGNYVWQDHMMAVINPKDEALFNDFIIELVYQNFFVRIDEEKVQELTGYINQCYRWLETHFMELLEKEQPDVLGLSVFSGSLPASVFTFRLTREKFPHIKTVMGGGVFAEALAPDSANLKFFLEKTSEVIDALFIGEGEQLFLKYLQGQLPTSQRVFSLADIDRQTLDLSTTRVPDLSGFKTANYPYLSTYTSRSCPFQCGFCSETVQWGAYRKKDARQVLKELKTLSQEHCCRLFLMSDSLLNPIVSQLAQAFIDDGGAPIYWDGYLRADKHVCKKENAELWRKGGYYRARLGIESGSPRVLELMGKQITAEQVRSALSNLASTGIKTTTYWVIGYPGETEEDFQQTLDLIEEKKDDIYEADCNPFTYFPTGQVNSGSWLEKHTHSLLYPPETRDMAWVQTWTMNCEPHRPEIFTRLNRFIQHCAHLDIPNPYSLREIHRADERWQQLHPNAVPPLMEFLTHRENKDHTTIPDETKNNPTMTTAQNTLQQDDNWGF